MDARSATLIVRYKSADGTWKRALAVRGANGRIRPGYALVNGRPEQQKDFLYQVRYYERRKLRYKSAGRNASDAEALRIKFENQATVRAEAARAGLKVEPEEKRPTLQATAAAYIRDAEQRGATEAAAQARNVTAEFLRLVRRTYVDEIKREDIFRFHAALRKRGCEDRTVANKHQRLTSWLRFAGIDQAILPPVPKYESKLPTIYTRDEISTILGAAKPYMRIAILLALKCGLRDRELRHAEFSDMNAATRPTEYAESRIGISA